MELPSPPSYARDFADRLHAFHELTGIEIVWKDAEGGAEGGLGEAVSQHHNVYCRWVKECPRRCARCVRDCNQMAGQQARRGEGPFVRTCHAGVTELVFPLFDGGRYAGLLGCGACRREGGRSPYRGGEVLYEDLSAHDTKRLARLECLVGGLVDSLTQLRSAARLAGAGPGVDARILQVQEQLAREPARAWRTAELASLCHLSPSRFLHLFKAETGLSVKAWLKARRLERACQLLAHTHLPVGEIAAEVGYGEANYFASVFRSVTGQSPTQYRRRERRAPAP